MDTRRVVLSGLSALALAACGESNGSDMAPALQAAAPETAIEAGADLNPVDWRAPCRLTRDADLAAVFKELKFDVSETVNDTLETSGKASGSCRYDARAFRAEDAYSVHVTLMVWHAKEQAYLEFEAETKTQADPAEAPEGERDTLVPREGVEWLEGFAEGGAYITAPDGSYSTFMHDGTLVRVAVEHDARATFDGHDPSIALARKIAEHL